jgi:ComF family protein
MATKYIFRTAHHLAQLYSKLMPIPCRLCGSPCQGQILCDQCANELPKIGSCCPRCALPTSNAQLCGQCLSSPPHQTLSFSLYPYLNPIDRLIVDFKFNDKLYMADFFANQMALKLKARPLPQLLIPIPLHPIRLKQRGYNQSNELAKSLSKRLAIPNSNDYLAKVINTEPQSSMPFNQRKRNIQHAFKATLPTAPKHIALIDDVLTTGHTANAAAKILKKAGAVTIEVWTIARTIRHD